MTSLRELIGKQLFLIRQKKKLTQDAVAERTGREGFNRSRVSKIESGQENITLDTLETMISALDITPYELFQFSAYQNPSDFKDKSAMIEAYKFLLMERPIEDIEYVVRTSKDFLETIDSKQHDRGTKP